MQTERIPVLVPFPAWAHVPESAGPLRISEVFDVRHFSETTGIPILEWNDIKKFPMNMTGAREATDVETIGCWSVQAQTHGNPRKNHASYVVRLDVSWTATGRVTILPVAEDYASLPQLATLAYPNRRRLALQEHHPLPSEKLKASLVPDEHLLCYDFLYFVGLVEPREWWTDYYPTWRHVLRHFRWSKKMEDLANEYLMRTFEVQKKEDIPPFITVHVRHTDFKDLCSGLPQNECFAPLSAFAHRVENIRRILKDNKGIDVQEVILTSDEKDQVFWREVEERGWRTINHEQEKTAEKHGRWYEILLDSAILSMGAGFVGTAESTMTMIAGRRVEDWNDGVWQMVKWGAHVVDDGL
jgi:hypothetical protein